MSRNAQRSTANPGTYSQPLGLIFLVSIVPPPVSSSTLSETRIIFARKMDRYARDFLSRHRDALVVHIGCGLDSHFERVDNGQVEWYDLDLPEVIDLHRKLIGDEHDRHHLPACSVLENAWLEAVTVYSQRPFLFLAETVVVRFTEAQVKLLVLRLRDHFPGSELVFDGWRPLTC